MKLTIDLETRSPVDLKKCGLYVYAEHPLTDVVCLAVKVDDMAPRIWVNPRIKHTGLSPYEPISTEEVNLRIGTADEIEAHNAAFERILWREVMTPRYGFLPITIEQITCSAAKAAAMSLPRSLGGACKALGLKEQKSFSGYQLMLRMCKPRKATKDEARNFSALNYILTEDDIWQPQDGAPDFCLWNEDPQDVSNLARYCAQDVNSEYELSENVPDLIKRERQVFIIDQKINDRGIQVDVAGAKKITGMVKSKEQKLLFEVEKLTSGKLTSARQGKRLMEWLSESSGIDIDNTQKATISEILKDIPEGTTKRVLQIRQSLSKASVAKFDALLRMACRDGRVKGMFMYHGAGTGRFTGKGLQVHNLKRECVDEEQLDAIIKLYPEMVEAIYDCPIILASKCVRGMLVAKDGFELIAADLNAIESRVLAWCAFDHKMLDNYKRNLDAYKISAEGIYNVKYEDVTKDQRQIGKMAELALGYQGHVGAFMKMAEGYGVKIKMPVSPEDREGIITMLGEETKTAGKTTQELYNALYESKVAEICNKWRRSRPEVVNLWREVEEAAIETIEKGTNTIVGRIGFSLRNKFLMMKLPSGRELAYYNPSVAMVTTKYGKEKKGIRFWGTESTGGKKTEWTLQGTYGGKLVENAVQAISRDILVEGMARLEKNGYPIVLHVHDEAIAEVPKGTGDLETFERLLATTPSWANGLPMKASGWIGKRYRKD